MKLGERLKLVLAEEIAQKVAAAKAEEERKLQIRAKVRSERQHLTSSIEGHISRQLCVGKLPYYEVANTELKAWLNRVHPRRTDAIQDQDLWDGLVDWLKEEGLKIKIGHGHDGMNKDWLEVGVELLPELEDEAD